MPLNREPASRDIGYPLWLFGLLLLIASLFITGCRIYSTNHAIQIPLVHLINTPTLYAGDPFASTLPLYASMVWRIVAWFNRLIPIEPLLLGLLIIERVLVLFAAAYLGKAFSNGSRLCIVLSMAIFALAPSPILGGGTIVTDYFEQTGFAIPFLFLAMAAFHNHRFVPWAIMLALGFNWNSMYGAYALSYFGSVIVFDEQYRQDIKKWALAIFLFLVLASPNIILSAAAIGQGEHDTALWVQSCRLRFPRHFHPLTWDVDKFIEFGVLAVVGVAILHRYRQQFHTLYRHGLIWTGVSLGWLALAFVAGHLLSIPFLLVIHPARGTDLWNCYMLVALMTVFVWRVSESRRGSLLLLLVLAPQLLVIDSVLAALIVIVLFAMLSVPVSDWVFRRGDLKRFAMGATSLILLYAVVFGIRKEVKDREEGWFFNQPHRSIRQVAQWAETSAPLEATFLVPPSWDQFRGLSKRGVFTTWKDGAAILWDRRFDQEWVRRLAALGVNLREYELRGKDAKRDLYTYYANLTDTDVEQLRDNFGIDYWVVSVAHKSAFRPAFQNPEFKILQVIEKQHTGSDRGIN
jgi:hypothetical protein